MLRFYNTLGRKVEEFVPLEKNKVGMYCCGLTAYNYAHIGNLRAYIFDDLLRRYLEYSGYEVRQVINITDVDDKTIRNSREANESLRKFTDFYTQAFLEDLKSVNIKIPTVMPRATEYIDEMVKLVKKLQEKDLAYKKDGSWYFRISKLPNYGELACLEKQELKQGAGETLLNADEYSKESVNDFVLWKAWREEDGEVFWETELGKGRPGWHIECSIMSMKELGEVFDIHCGGEDLIFPHHTNEIAQSEGVTGKKFVNYWLHNAHLLVNGEKMSKSLNNFYTLRDIMNNGYHPLLVRLLLLKTHYRQVSDFSFDSLKEMKTMAGNFIEFLVNLDCVVDGSKGEKDLKNLIDDARVKFKEAMDDDLNISGALGEIFDLINEVNKVMGKISKAQALMVKDFIFEIDQVLGFVEILYDEYKERLAMKMEDKILREKIELRQKLREEKKWKEADKIRDDLLLDGVVVKDVVGGYVVCLRYFI